MRGDHQTRDENSRQPWEDPQRPRRGKRGEIRPPSLKAEGGGATHPEGNVRTLCTSAEGWAPTKSTLNAPVEDPKASRTLRRGDGEGSGNPNARRWAEERRWEEDRKPSPRRSVSIRGAKDRKSVPPGSGSTRRNMRKTHTGQWVLRSARPASSASTPFGHLSGYF